MVSCERKAEYKADHNLKFDEVFVGQMIRDYTSGLSDMLKSIIFGGKRVSFNYYDRDINIAVMFNFVKEELGATKIACRIFETWLYNRHGQASYHLTAWHLQREIGLPHRLYSSPCLYHLSYLQLGSRNHPSILRSNLLEKE